MKQFWKLCFVILALSSACGEQPGEKSETKKPAYEPPLEIYEGIYVSDGYNRQKEGFDWVSVAITKTFDSLYYVRIRSRIDKKKPTCTCTSEAKLSKDGTLIGAPSNIPFIIKKTKRGIEISKVGEVALNYFCSGGATLEGDYEKIKGNLPKKQLDSQNFYTCLNSGKINFFIEQNKNEVIITPSGLKIDNSKITEKISGMVVNAEIADLDSNGSPEIYIYIRQTKNNHMHLLAYQVNNKKSMSAIALPHDFYKTDGNEEMAIVENCLAVRYKLKSGKMRQLQYKLVQGEASPQLKLDRTTIF